MWNDIFTFVVVFFYSLKERKLYSHFPIPQLRITVVAFFWAWVSKCNTVETLPFQSDSEENTISSYIRTADLRQGYQVLSLLFQHPCFQCIDCQCCFSKEFFTLSLSFFFSIFLAAIIPTPLSLKSQISFWFKAALA